MAPLPVTIGVPPETTRSSWSLIKIVAGLIHPVGDPLRVPLPGARPRSLVPGGGRPADRLARDQPSPALRPGAQQLLRGAPAAPTGGRRPPGPSDRPGDRGPRARSLALERSARRAGRRYHRLDARLRGEPERLPAIEGSRDRAGVSAGPDGRDHLAGHRGRARPGARSVPGEGDGRD